MTIDSTTARCTAMSQASYLIGRWAGDGQIRNAGGSHYFTQTETVNAHLGGELLTIEGAGWDRDDPTRRVHAAMAVMTYDPERQRYLWRAYSAGQWTDTELHLLPQGFSWALDPAPRVVIRYTATIDGNTWEEIGEIAQNGEPWSTILSMRLSRQD
jgi:hypothetical protein